MFGRARVGQFLLNLLAAATVSRYRAGLQHFERWCQARRLAWEELPEEEQDWAASDFGLDLMDDGYAVQVAKDALCALQKTWPRRKFVTAWTVVRGWGGL